MNTSEIEKYYIYELGSRKGEVEIYLAESEESVYFKSGRFVSIDQWQGNYMRQIEEREYNSINKQKDNSIQSQEAKYLEWEGMLGTKNPVENSTEIKETQLKPEDVVETNPIKIILDKQKNKDKVNIPISIEASIPSKKVMSLLDIMFDREEVTKEIIKSIVSTIDVDFIVDTIEKEIKSTIENSYLDEEEKK
tara:strand:+ start:160 stop:738 length:579 start_codon:yes stop_codon:yes gene_type:complete